MFLADTSRELMTSQHSGRYKAIVQAVGKQAGGQAAWGDESMWGETQVFQHLQVAAVSVWMWRSPGQPLGHTSLSVPTCKMALIKIEGDNLRPWVTLRIN